MQHTDTNLTKPLLLQNVINSFCQNLSSVSNVDEPLLLSLHVSKSILYNSPSKARFSWKGCKFVFGEKGIAWFIVTTRRYFVAPFKTYIWYMRVMICL